VFFHQRKKKKRALPGRFAWWKGGKGDLGGKEPANFRRKKKGEKRRGERKKKKEKVPLLITVCRRKRERKREGGEKKGEGGGGDLFRLDYPLISLQDDRRGGKKRKKKDRKEKGEKINRAHSLHFPPSSARKRREIRKKRTASRVFHWRA